MDAFGDLVEEALAGLPPDLARLLENVQVVVEDWPTPRQRAEVGLGRGEILYGLYEGVPLTERGAHYGLVLPDKITIFRGSILAAHRRPAEVRWEVRRTVVHELAHHFGIDDGRLEELDAY